MEKKIGEKNLMENNSDDKKVQDQQNCMEEKLEKKKVDEKKVFIILLNYKGYEDTKECINSLKQIDYKNFQVIVVDNDSRDGSFERLQAEFGSITGENAHVEPQGNKVTESSDILIPADNSSQDNISADPADFQPMEDGNLHFMSSGKNGGFAYGNNRGIEYALNKEADYVLLLNNDTLVEKDFLNILVSEAESHKDAGIVTGKILYESKRDSVWFGGGEINWDRFYGFHSHYEDARYITFSTGCLMLIRKEVLEKVGLLPEQYFMYYEDVDFCAMLQEAGFKIYYTPKSIIYHKVSASTGEEESPFAVFWNTRNRLKFMNKYKKKKGYLKGKAFFYATRVPVLMKYVAKGRGDKAKNLIKGLKG